MKRTLKQKLYQEALDFYKIETMLDFDEDDFDDIEDTGEGIPQSELQKFGEEEGDDMFSDDFGNFEEEGEPEGDMFGEEEPEGDMFADEEGESQSNPDKEGLIRTVRGAYLVYKRATAESNFEELWLYNMGNVKTQTHVRNAILAGTDIDPITLRSPTNDQTAEVWSKGNVQYLHVNGLPN
jgi:hypothetical protein